MKAPIIAVIVVVLVVVVIAVLFLSKNLPGINKPSQSIAAQTTFSSLIAASQNLYNSASPFNFSYTFEMYNSSSLNSSSLRMGNGTFSLAMFNQDFRISFQTKYLVLPQITYKTRAFLFYNKTNIYRCSQSRYENITPVNSTLLSEINAINVNSTLKCQGVVAPSNVTSFDLAYMFGLVPFSISEPLSTSNLNSISPTIALANASISYIGNKTYVGENCDLEKLVPPVSSSSYSQNESVTECISTSNVLPSSGIFYQNNKVIIENNLASVNPAPTSIAGITATS